MESEQWPGRADEGAIRILGTVQRDRLWADSLGRTRRKPLDDSQNADVADRAGMLRSGFVNRGGFDRYGAQQSHTKRQLIFAAAIGEPAEVSDLYKPRRKDMLQEAAQELHCADGHDFALAIPIIAPAEAHLAILEGDQPRVRDGDAVGVAGEIFQNLLGSAKRRLGIDHPF